MEEPKEITGEYESWRDELHRAVEQGEEDYLLDYYSIRASAGEVKRGVITKTPTQFTLDNKTREIWDEFIMVYTGTKPERGRGISSPLADTALLLLVAVITEFGIEEIADRLVGMLNSRKDVHRLITHVESLADELERYRPT